MTKHQRLTQRQEAILRFIIRYKTDNGGDSPSYREIMRAVGLASQSIVHYNLGRLEARGLITRGGLGESRRIAVTGGRWVYEPQETAQ